MTKLQKIKKITVFWDISGSFREFYGFLNVTVNSIYSSLLMTPCTRLTNWSDVQSVRVIRAKKNIKVTILKMLQKWRGGGLKIGVTSNCSLKVYIR